MIRKLLLTIPLLVLPNLAVAQSSGPGSGDVPRVQREVEAMQRDGRWQRLLAEQQANRLGSEPLLAAPQLRLGTPVFAAEAPVRPRKRRN